MVLIKFRGDTNDADYVYGFTVFEKERWEEIKRKTEKLFEREEEVSVGCLSNEQIRWYSYDEWLECYTEFEISDEEYESLKRIFFSHRGRIYYGFFASPIDYYDDVD